MVYEKPVMEFTELEDLTDIVCTSCPENQNVGGLDNDTFDFC